jgi:hypothetical protein
MIASNTLFRIPRESRFTVPYLRLLFAFTFMFVTWQDAIAQSSQTILSGEVRNPSGQPVAGAAVSIRPARVGAVHSDAKGRFSFRDVPSGTYTISVTKSGFQQWNFGGYTVPQHEPLIVVLSPSTLSTLAQIATVRTSAGNNFNTSASAMVTLPQETFLDKGQVQIGHVLDQIPGVVSARPGSANPAAPGSITSPNLRGALDYEKATLLDGHPLINGARGDYPTMLVNSLLFDDVEIVKGPTAYAPEINYGIGGTLNFVTGEPTASPSGRLLLGFDNQSGSFANLRLSNTVANGKLGYLFDFVTDGTQGPLRSTPTSVTLPYGTTAATTTLINGGTLTKNTTSGKPINGVSGPYPVRGSLGNPSDAYTTLVACCQNVTSNFLDRGEVAKLSYHLSNSTVLTAGYVGIQAQYDGAASGLAQIDSTFAPSSLYGSGSGLAFSPGQQFLLNSTTTIPNQTVYDNEPMFESELRTTIGNNTFLARYYSAVLERQTVSNSTNPFAGYSSDMTLYGTAYLNGSSTPTVFDGQRAVVTIPASIAYTNNMSDHDYLHGITGEFDHPAGDDLYTLAYDLDTSLTNSYRIAGGTGATITSIAAGTRQDFSTYLLRAVYPVGPKGQLTLANYYNIYRSTYTPFTFNGSYAFATSTTTHDDPRLGFSYRASPDVAIRFSAGSSIAPPYPSLIDNLNTTPAQVTPVAGTITISKNSGTLRPETSFAYDLGSDVRFRSGDTLSADVYLTNIWNQFATEISDTGTQFNGNAVYESTNANLAQSRYEGVELTLRRDPNEGWGYTFSGMLQRAYAYNISPGFYATALGPYTTNLGVVPGINYYSFGNGYNGISNKSEAYSMGYASIHRRGAFGQYAEFGLTYYGSNNTYNIPAFVVGSASYRQPVARDTSIQLSADNLFSTNALDYVYYGAGSNAIPAPLVNSEIGLRGQIPYGPTTYQLILTRSFGS